MEYFSILLLTITTVLTVTSGTGNGSDRGRAELGLAGLLFWRI